MPTDLNAVLQWRRRDLHSWRVRWTAEHNGWRMEIDRDRRCRFHARLYRPSGKMAGETRRPASFRDAREWCCRELWRMDAD